MTKYRNPSVKIQEQYPEIYNSYKALDYGAVASSQIAFGSAIFSIFYNLFKPTSAAQKPEKSKNTEANNSDEKVINYRDLQLIIDKRKSNSSRGFADLSDFVGWKMAGESFIKDFVTDDDSTYLERFDIQAFHGMNLSHTNALEVFSINNFYFYCTDFSGLKFQNNELLFLDGCDLSGASFANTVQKNLYLGGLTSFFVELEAMDLDAHLRYNTDRLGTPEYSTALQRMEVLRKISQELEGTKAHYVDFSNTVFDGYFSDNYLVDYTKANFSGATLNTYSSFFSGNNAQLQGLRIRTQDNDFVTITDPITKEEIAEKHGHYVAQLLGNQVVSRNDKKPMVIAISGTDIDPNWQKVIQKCNRIFKQQLSADPIDSQKAQEIADMFNGLTNPNPNNPKYNVRYIVDDGVTPHDFSNVYCNFTGISAAGETAGLGMVGDRGYTAVLSRKISRSLFLHEEMHQTGAQHPQDSGIFPTRSTSFASNAAYNNGKNLMVKISDAQHPLFLNYIEGYGVQDHKILEVVSVLIQTTKLTILSLQ